MKSSRPRREKADDEASIIKLVNMVREFESKSAFNAIEKYLASALGHFESKYHIPGCDGDEIYQECMVALRYKAIEDFNPDRGKFKSFAVLCIKRHLFSLIKGNKQHKRRVLNESLSLDEDRSDNGDNLSLASLITKEGFTVDEAFARNEVFATRSYHLLSRLSKLEQEVFKCYIQQNSYEEIVAALREVFPEKRRISKKTVNYRPVAEATLQMNWENSGNSKLFRQQDNPEPSLQCTVGRCRDYWRSSDCLITSVSTQHPKWVKI